MTTASPCWFQTFFRASAGYWQERKRSWLALGIQSEKGRDDGMLRHMAALAEKAGDGKLPEESIFAPVLCEIMYRWFCPDGGRLLDPFAGGSVRGLVAGKLGFRYTGIDLRDEQIAARCGLASSRALSYEIAPMCSHILIVLISSVCFIISSFIFVFSKIYSVELRE